MLRGFKSIAAVVVTCCLIGASAIVATGCGKSSAALPVKTIYLSVPLSGPIAQRGIDMVAAARLLLRKTNYNTPDVSLKLVVQDSNNKPGDNARLAAADPRSIAYIGDVTDADTLATQRQTRAKRLLVISLAPALRPPPVEGSGKINVVRLLPTAESEGQAMAQQAAGFGATPLRFNGGRSAFAEAVRRGYEAGVANIAKTKPSPGLRFRDFSKAEQSELAGFASVSAASKPVSDPAAVERLLLVADDPSRPSAGLNNTLISPTLPEDDYAPIGQRFFKSFEKDYGRTADRYTIYAYEAVGLALDAIHRAGQHNASITRDDVTTTALGIQNRFGPVGHYDVLPNGQTTLYIFSATPTQRRSEAESDDPVKLIEVER